MERSKVNEGVEESNIFLNNGGWWVQEVLPFEFYQPVFKKVALTGLNSLLQKRC